MFLAFHCLKNRKQHDPWHWDPAVYLEDILKHVLDLDLTEPLVREIMH